MRACQTGRDRAHLRCSRGILTRSRERPAARREENSTLITGTIDLLLDTEEGFVLVDHKTFPGGREQAVGRARRYAAQLDEYAVIIECAQGRRVIDRVIHLPILGMVVRDLRVKSI